MRLRDFRHICIVQTAYLGDAALALYLAHRVRSLAGADARISFVCAPESAPLAECSPAVDETLVFDKRDADAGFWGIERAARRLRSRKVELLLSPHRSFRSSLLARRANARLTVGFSSAAGSFLYDRLVEYPAHLHEIERNARLVGMFEDDLPPDNDRSNTDRRDDPRARPMLRLPDWAREECARVQAEIQRRTGSTEFFALAPGSARPTKQWSQESFAELARKITAQTGKATVLLGGEKDRLLCQWIARHSETLYGGALSLAGQTPLPVSLALLETATALVANDSAPVHLAALVNCPTTAIFGPTSPALGFAPRSDRAAIVENAALGCRPCSPHGGARCPLGTRECMRSVSVDEVLRAVLSVARV
jgi:heptosyltransferase-2